MRGACTGRNRAPRRRSLNSPASRIRPARCAGPTRASSRLPGARSTAGRLTIMRAAFATFLASCRALVGSAKSSRDARPVYPALVEICRKARAGGAQSDEAARKFFEENFARRARVEDRRPERIPHRLLRTDRRRLARSNRRLQGAALRPAARPRAHGTQAQGGELSEHRPRRAPHRARQVRAVFRPRANRGWRARDAQSGNRLPEGCERSPVHPDPGLGAHPPAPTARCCASITIRTTAIPTRRSAAS